jgi:hypothetical protein
MSEPFQPKHMGDIRTYFDELWERTGNVPGYSDGLRGEVFNLIAQSERILQFDPLGKQYVTEATGILYAGNARIALAKFKLALDSYLPT